MITCQECGVRYDDEFRLTTCPHDTFAARAYLKSAPGSSRKSEDGCGEAGFGVRGQKVAIIFAEFGGHEVNTEQYRRVFPEADIRVLREADCPNVWPDRPRHSRHGWRMNDYWKVRALFNSALNGGAEIALCFDADMRVANPRMLRTLPLLAERFGLCLPANPRHLVEIDTLLGADSDHVIDETLGSGYALNCSPIALNVNHPQAREAAQAYCSLMEEHPVRGPLAWWRALWQTGFSPCLLPPQWCVCEADIGCGHEILLHEGHAAVKTHYREMFASV